MVMRITGFSSGLDIDQIVKDLMKAERAPQDKIYQKQQWAEYQRDAYRDINLAMDKFKKSVENLRFQSTFNAYSATSSDSTSFSVKSTSNSIPGNYSVVVDQIAKIANLTSSDAIKSNGSNVKSSDLILSPGETATIKVQSANGEKEITIDDTFTYSRLAKEISNATDETTGKSLGLRAMFDDATSRFVIASKDLGAKQQISLSDISGNIAGLIKDGGDRTSANSLTNPFTVTGEDASVTVNGATVTSSSNNISVYGMNITLLKEDPGVTKTISVKSDSDNVFNSIKSFVEEYNKLIDTVNSKLNEKRYRDYQPLTKEQREALSENEAKLWDEKAKSGVLSRDSLLTETMSQLRTYLSMPVDGIPSNELNSLSKIGITTEYMSLDGKLQINEDKLREAINNNPEQIMNLFTKSGSKDTSTSTASLKDSGIGDRLYEMLKSTITKLNDKAGAPNTAANIDKSVLGKSISEYSTQYNDWIDKLATIESRYYKQFNAMEEAIQKLNNQMSYITSALGG
ncbi:flagellar filament capping protein FliD [Heyndrickxia oleronia]|uniref:Flagellar hook-associated protein 2 n=1 Tax=Heyndrickxia oleronia TaxID=38875 RepID=A0AAW6SRA9_9BACI|nr:flagellar filament capping protein FliD [Heyndrickxia oleronia]MDH5161289.1 flagellar filament capping protein FliD [Heyndrickxia oleronia]